MDSEEQQEMDSKLGDVMGFTNFGAQPDTKKRKTSHDSPVTTTASSTQYPSLPINYNDMHNQPLTHNPIHPPAPAAAAAGTSASPSTEQPKNAFPTGVPMDIFYKLTWKELEAYRKGVKKENGDLAWFLPSFIEDPWAKLEKSGSGAGSS
jgi:hypothetical protein